jgi:hypothetical protein
VGTVLAAAPPIELLVDRYLIAKRRCTMAAFLAFVGQAPLGVCQRYG